MAAVRAGTSGLLTSRQVGLQTPLIACTLTAKLPRHLHGGLLDDWNHRSDTMAPTCRLSGNDTAATVSYTRAMPWHQEVSTALRTLSNGTTPLF